MGISYSHRRGTSLKPWYDPLTLCKVLALPSKGDKHSSQDQVLVIPGRKRRRPPIRAIVPEPDFSRERDFLMQMPER
jgi:hypothetical protein